MALTLNKELKIYIVEVICLLYVLLFVYAAVSKLMDFENFQVQLGQSPILSVYAMLLSWMVPLLELIIALLLIVPKLRNSGLFLAVSLMTMFSVYIYIILHYSSFVPCSCGGVLEKMTWDAHLVFNLIFMALGCLAFIINYKSIRDPALIRIPIRPIKSIPINIILSTLFIIVLFFSSEDKMQHKNPFIRRYPQHPIMRERSTDLKFNSYYFAGYDNNTIYLGNYTDPLHVLSMDATLGNRRTEKIIFDPKKIRFKMVKIIVRGSYFYLMDGSVPAVFKGKTINWKIDKEFKDLPFFTRAEPVDSTALVFRSNKGQKGEQIIGAYNEDKAPTTVYNSSFLQKQIDGIFDTDGQLVFSEKLNQVVYVYYYRNQYIVADPNAVVAYRGRTIDTISKAKIKVAYLEDRKERKMAAPPLLVNEHVVACENLLFVHSTIQGKFEDEKLWQQAYIIDVYDLTKKIYVMSFALYKIRDKKFRSFFVTASNLYAIMDDELVVYQLQDILKKEIMSNRNKSF